VRQVVLTMFPRRGVSEVADCLATSSAYRRIALDALDHLGVRHLSRRPRPFPSATGLDQIYRPAEVMCRRAATS
jgi:hypothetical protein